MHRSAIIRGSLKGISVALTMPRAVKGTHLATRRSSRLATSSKEDKAENSVSGTGDANRSSPHHLEGYLFYPKRKGKKVGARAPITLRRPSVDINTLADRKLLALRQSKEIEPFPKWVRPEPEECLMVAELLRIAHGYAEIPKLQPPNGDDKYGGCGDVSDVLDALIRTVLSCNTTNKNSRAQHKSLCETFGKKNWQAILDAPHAQVAEALRCGGLHENKARVVQGILQQTLDKYGKFSLDHLHHADSATVMEELVSFKGVGPKVASCVAMFAIGLDEMAVDTHVYRIVKRMGWVPPNASRDQTYHHLAARVPNNLKYALHILIIKHGKACAACSARGSPTEPYRMQDVERLEAAFKDAEDRFYAKRPGKKAYQAVLCPLKKAKLFKRTPLVNPDRVKAEESGQDCASSTSVKPESGLEDVKVKPEESHVEL